jgi:hypothetical protein
MARLVAWACLIISGSLAAAYGYATGNSELYGILRAIGWGAVAVVGGCVPAWFFHHIDARAYGQAIVTALAGSVCFAVTIYGSVGGISGSGDKVAAERSKAISVAGDNQAELSRIKSNLAKLPAYRPISTVQAEIEAAKATKAYKASDGCTPVKVTLSTTREACEVFRKLEGELEMGKAAAKLEADAERIRGRLAQGPVMQTADPGATALALITNVSPDRVSAWSALLGSLALELAGMVAMMRAESSYVPGSIVVKVPPATLKSGEVVPMIPRAKMAAVPTKMGDVDQFMLDGVTKGSKSAKVSWAELYIRYRAWCDGKKVVPVDAKAFGARLDALRDELGLRVRTKGNDVYFLELEPAS